MRDSTSEQNGADNLTFKENVIRQHAGLDSLPGYVVAVFEKLPKGGESFFKLVSSGERFRVPFWVSSQKYFAVAVNQSFLSYSFEQPVTMDDGIHKFTLMFHLKYKVAEPQRVAELREQDPLGRLSREITQVVGRSCAQRRWEMVKDRFRDLEVVVMNGEKVRLRQYAATLGFEILSVELDKCLPDDVVKIPKARERAEAEKQMFEIEHEVKRTKEEISRAREHLRRLEDIEHQYSVREKELTEQLKLRGTQDAINKAERQHDIESAKHQYDIRETELDKKLELDERIDRLDMADQARKLRGYRTEAIGKALDNVGSGISTPGELLEGAQVAHQISMGLQPDGGPSALSPGTPDKNLIGPGADSLSSLLGHAITQIEQWNCTFAQKQALRSAIMHIVAEVQLDDHASKEVLRQHADQLKELSKKLNLPPSQYSFLKRFWDYEQLPGYRK
jgi:hypothetical protein